MASGLAVVTDGDIVNVNRLVKRLDLERYFGAIITSEAVRAYKPNPRIYRAALEALGAAPRDSVFVSPSARESGEPNRKPGARSDRVPRRGVDGAHRDLRSPDLQHGLGVEPRIRFELGIHPWRSPFPLRALQFAWQLAQGLVIESRSEFAGRPKDIGLFVVGGHEQGAVRPRSFPPARKGTDDDEIDRVAQGRAVFLLEFDPLEPSRPRVVPRLERLRHETFASRLKRFVEKLLGFLHGIRDPHGRQPDAVVRAEDRVQGLASLAVGPRREILIFPEETVKCEEGDGELRGHLVHVRLASASTAHLLERQEFARVRVDGDSLPFEDGRAVLDRGTQAFHNLGELSSDILQVSGE